MRAARVLLLTLLAFAVNMSAASAEAARKAAVFPAEMNDPTLPYGRKSPPADLKRLDLVTDQLRKTLAQAGGIESVDLQPQKAEIDRQSPLFKCNGCEGDIAKALGADLFVNAVAEKGGPQLFNLSVTISDAASGKVVRAGRVVISANTDDDWAHAVRSILKNQLLAQPLPSRS